MWEKEYTMNIVKKYIGKRICLEYYIDQSYRVEGTPQYNSVLWVNGIRVYNQKVKYDSDLKNDFDALKSFGREIGQYRKALNYYGMFDFEYNFVVTDKLFDFINKGE